MVVLSRCICGGSFEGLLPCVKVGSTGKEFMLLLFPFCCDVDVKARNDLPLLYTLLLFLFFDIIDDKLLTILLLDLSS